MKFVPPLIEDNFKDLKLEFRLSQIFINDHSVCFSLQTLRALTGLVKVQK